MDPTKDQFVSQGQGRYEPHEGPEPTGTCLNCGVLVDQWRRAKRLTPHLTLAAQASLFTAGPFVRETQAQPADDIYFVAATATYRF